MNQYQAQEIAEVWRDPFSYNAIFASIAPGISANYNINIQQDADFLIQATMAEARNTTGAVLVAVPNAVVLITDGGSGRQLMDTDVPIGNLFGNGQFPFVWPQPKVIAARSTLVIRVTNNDATLTMSFKLTFAGVKLFQTPANMNAGV